MGDANNEVGVHLDAYIKGHLSRRGFLVRAAALGVGAVAAGQMLAACSSDASTAGSAAAGTGSATGAAAGAQPVGGGIFREGYDRAPTPPDPVRNAWADPSFNAFYEALVVRDAQGTIVPMLASSFANDEKAWTFTLRDGLTFHSGAACTPDVVVADFDLFRDPESGQNSPFWGPITSVKADGQVIVCATAHPFAAFQETVATEYSYILNPAAREKAGDTYGSEVVDGTGPFVLESFAPQEVKAKKWDKYPGSVTPFFSNKGPAYLDGITWVSITEASQRAPEVETGNVDAVKNPPPQDVDRLKSNPELVVQEFQELSNFFLSVNVGDASLGFDDPRVRQAISQAIDREGIVQSIFLGHAAATYGPVMPGWAWYNPAVEQFNQYDPAAAGKLLDEAGWTLGSDGIREKGGKKLSFTTTQLQDNVEVQVMQAVVEMLKQVGVEMKAEPLDAAAFFPQLTNELTSYAFKWLWSSPIDVVSLFVQFYQPQSPVLDEVNAAFAKWQNAAATEELKDAAYTVQEVFARSLPLIPLYTPNTIWVNRTNVMGWHPNQANLYPFYNDVWLAV